MRFHRSAPVFVACLVAVSGASPSHAGGSNTEHELAVYSLTQYGTYLSQAWKGSIPAASRMNPYEDFYELLMDNCTTSECAHTSSARFQNSAVTVNQMTSTAGTTSDRGWSSSDLVFFYGHNTQIQPQWESDISAWHYNSEFGQWYQTYYSDWRSWGTASNPYEYHRYTIGNASLSNAFSVFYAYNPFTSVLIGQDFSASGTWYTENTWNQGVADSHTSTLNTELEWVIANGCNAVSVADPWGHSLPLAKNAWSKSWTGTHMVLGHYATTITAYLPHLDDFAQWLMEGDLLKEAYWQAHWWQDRYNPLGSYESDWPGYAQPSAIGRAPTSCCYSWNGFVFCPTQGCTGDYFSSDKWHPNSMSDLTTNFYYATSWRTRKSIFE